MSAITRRQFLGRAGAAVGAVVAGGPLLAGCSGGDGGGPLRIASWPYYIDAETVPAFSRERDVTVDYREAISDNEQLFDEIAPALTAHRDPGYDIVVVTDWMVTRLIGLGWAARLAQGKIPNKTNIRDDLANPVWDPGRRYSLPWAGGMVGIAYHPERTGGDLATMADLLQVSLGGKVALLSELRDTFGMLLLDSGRQPESATLADVERLAERVTQLRESGQVRLLGNEYGELLASGELAACLAWSGDVVSIQQTNPEIRFVVPTTGGMRYNDNMVVLATSTRADAAHEWMNYVYEPAHAARIVAGAPFISPVEHADEELAKLAPDLAANPLVNPNAATKSRLHDFRTFFGDEAARFEEIARSVVGA